MKILQGNKRFVESKFEDEKEDLEELVRSQSKVFFGEDTIFITKRKLKGLVRGETIPDGFLFDLTDSENPGFYLVEFELQKHSFKSHIQPQINNFFEFFHNPASQSHLVEDFYSHINANATLKNEFRKYLGDKDTHKFLTDIWKHSQNVLLIIDGGLEESSNTSKQLSDHMKNSSDWVKFVNVLTVRKFSNENETLVSVEPDFMDIQSPPTTEAVLEVDHKTPSQLAMMAAEISSSRNANVSISKVAKKLGVSRETVYVAKRIMQASPQLAKQVKSGNLSLNSAKMQIAKTTEQD